MIAGNNLSKEEIKELSEALGGFGAKRIARSELVHSYDFEHPLKLSRSNLRALQLVYSGVERPWSGVLSAVLKADVEIKIGAIEQTSFRAYAESLPIAGVQASVRLGSLPGEAIIDLPPELAARIVDGMVGGRGEIPLLPKRPSMVELSLLKRLLARLCPGLSSAWSPVAGLACELLYIHRSIREIEIEAAEPMIVTCMSWIVDGQDYRVNVAMPETSIDRVIDSLDPQRWVRTEDNQTIKTDMPSIAALLDPVDIDISVELGKAVVNMEGLMSMEVGDVISLDRTASEPLDIRVGGSLKFHGNAGLVGRKMSVQVQEAVDGIRDRPTAIRNMAFAVIEE